MASELSRGDQIHMKLDYIEGVLNLIMNNGDEDGIHLSPRRFIDQALIGAAETLREVKELIAADSSASSADRY